MFNNSILSLQKNSKNKLDGLIEWVGPSKLLQNEHFKMYNFDF